MSNLDTALEYAEQILGAPYGWWIDGPVPDGAPAWATNAPPPHPSEVNASSCFCAGVPNLMLRSVGKVVPYTHWGEELWDGGCLAYGNYFWAYSEPFSIAKALSGEYPKGTLIGRYFTWDRNAWGDQGHVAVLLENGWVLQSYDAGGGSPGVNWDAQIKDSHAGWYYEYAVLPENWINYQGDEF